MARQAIGDPGIWRKTGPFECLGNISAVQTGRGKANQAYINQADSISFKDQSLFVILEMCILP